MLCVCARVVVLKVPGVSGCFVCMSPDSAISVWRCKHASRQHSRSLALALWDHLPWSILNQVCMFALCRYMLQVSAVPGTSSFGACNGISGNPQSSSNGNDDESAHQHLPPLARVHAVACSQEGMLHAVQTLLQLLPPPVATPVVPSNNSHRPVPGPDASRAAVLLLPTCQVSMQALVESKPGSRNQHV